jgi:hypothetical protein
VGSVLEDEDQQGLAHLCEHMAFNGTKHFAKQELVDYLESIGTRFGPDLNAYTSFDETVYLFINGARNLEDPGAADALIAIASDGKIDRGLRREALLSFPFLKDPSLGEKLLHYAAEEKDRALAECAERVFWNFF